jgi:hypothetical protein
MAISEATERLTATLAAHAAVDDLCELLGPKRTNELLTVLVLRCDAAQNQPVNRARKQDHE